MTKSGGLAILLLVLGSMAAAAEPQQAASGSPQAQAAQSDNVTRLATVYCDAKFWRSTKCMGDKLFHCDNSEDHSCKVTSKCKLFYPTKHCHGL